MDKDPNTQAQIAHVLFAAVERGDAITPEQEKQLCDWIRRKGHFARRREADYEDNHSGDSSPED
jgi:hypothetical protein